MSEKSAPIVLAAGGTGGHIFPAEALAEVLHAQGYKVTLITDERFAGYNNSAYKGVIGEIPVYYIKASTFSGGIVSKIKGIIKVGLGIWQARGMLKKIKPAVVVGFGGYPSFPTMMAATQMGIKTAIHEQNSVLGRANRVLAPKVNRIAVSYENTNRLPKELHGKKLFTGNPVRASICALNNVPYSALKESGTMKILVLGGSQGATVFGNILPDAIKLLPENLRSHVRIDQQCRPEDIEQVRERYKELGVSVDLATFFHDVPARMAAAHLVICRAGASTLAEVTTAGRPAIMVPLPSATDNHQMHNAQAVEDVGGGWVMPQEGFTAEALAVKLESFLTLPGALDKAAALVRKIGAANAADQLAEIVLELASKGQAKSVSAAAVPKEQLKDVA